MVTSTTINANAAYLLGLAWTAVGDFYAPLMWWLFGLFCIVLADLRFGMAAARKRGETVRWSRAWRRTIAKFFDYFCWVSVAGFCSHTVGTVFGAPILSLALLTFLATLELGSAINNWLEARGITKKHFDFWKMLKTRNFLESFVDKEEDAS